MGKELRKEVFILGLSILGDILVTNIVERTGTFTPVSGVTISEARIKQVGKFVEVHFFAEKDSAFGTSAVTIGQITGVDTPPRTIRTIFGADTHAYDVTGYAYAYIGTNGGINITSVNSSHTVVLVDIVYSVDTGITEGATEIVDDLVTDSSIAALSAKQGKVLDEEIKARIIYRTFTFTNVPVTTRSASGAYYLVDNSLNIGVSGYIPISATILDWGQWTANASPYIRTGSSTLAFTSDISQTLGSVTVHIVYIKA